MKQAQFHAQDRSRHLLCPSCRVRTRLYPLRDGRRKCSACGKKFHPVKKTDLARLRQYADMLLCFCLDLTGKKASELSGYHYRLVSVAYDRIRMLLAAQNLTPGKLRLLTSVASCSHTTHDSAFCLRCRSRFGCTGRKSGDSPVFGVKILGNGQVFIDPLEDHEAIARLDGHATTVFASYAGFICRGRFHRFADNPRVSDGAERLWAWVSERLKRHHGIWKGNAGLYLKELEWKYNNRLLSAETQATTIARLVPVHFLRAWSDGGRVALNLVQNNA